MQTKILIALLYTLGWFFLVLCGAHLHTTTAIFGGLALILLELFISKKGSEKNAYNDLLLMICATILGFLIETLFISLKVMQYKSLNSLFLFFPPGWILLLYPLFSITLNHSLAFLNNSRVLAFFFGFIGAPFSYLAGSSMGAVIFPLNLSYSLAMIALFWGFFMFLLVVINKKLKVWLVTTERGKPSEDNDPK